MRVSCCVEETEVLFATAQTAFVHSVYRQVINICWHDRLFAFHPATLPETALSIVLSGESDLSCLHLAPGDPVCFAQDRVLLGGCSCDAKGRRYWNPRLRLSLSAIHRRRLAAAIASALPAYKGRGGFADATPNDSAPSAELLPGTLAARARAVLQAGTAGAAAAARTARDLIGLGPGLTPSGDDFLLGLLAVLCASGQEGQAWFRAFGGAVCAALDRTNDLSARFLACAAAGQYGRKLHNLLHAVRACTALDPYVQALAGTGHSSGVDTLCGMACACALLGTVSLERGAPCRQ